MNFVIDIAGRTGYPDFSLFKFVHAQKLVTSVACVMLLLSLLLNAFNQSRLDEQHCHMFGFSFRF